MPDVIEEIRTTLGEDLSWVTFAEEDPKEPCGFHECSLDSTHIVTALPCGHEYFFCTQHVNHTREMLRVHDILTCAQCPGIVNDCKFEPLKRG